MQAKFTYAIRFTDDMEGAVAFFRDKLGLKLRFASPGWSEFETGDVTLALHPASPRNPAGTVELGFGVDDVARLHAQAQAQGLVFSADPKNEHGTTLARIRDPEGAEISLSS